MLLSDKVAIITGGARGMGRGIAEKFTEEGCAVTIADIIENEAKDVAAKISERGGKALAIGCDQTDSRQVQDMVDKTISQFGKIDILVNTAGVGAAPESIADYPEDQWDRILDINLKGPFLCSKYVSPHMKKNRSGSIIYFSSIVAISPSPTGAPYSAAKAGVIGLMYSTAVEMAAFNVRVNVILPGVAQTQFYDSAIPPDLDKDVFFKNVGKHVPLGRVGTPEDFAGVSLFLASDLSSYVTGSQILVAGGVPLWLPE